ncbi:hypothetical protein OPT61_g5105 [Boeremia exigua]|uniref:Uncharacterized protein n=1 Tax=Boeremia exigua TaxID=749465 RepID=A0ACC2IBM7_9PLEO|nr:hypothetical protein OPT61_g5105 [Boeremia exigua]
MATQRPRANAVPRSGINDLIDAANSGDRFKLLEDDTILPANLTNPIHPIFRQLEGHHQIQLALQLASHFLLHDRLLQFFVPLLYGREIHDSKAAKTYLRDPLLHSSKARQAQLLSAVHQALQCLAHRLKISFIKQKKRRVYARTISNDVISPLASTCCSDFQTKVSPEIELSDDFLKFYKEPNGYAKASRCAKYRHDFLFATTLVHEVVHAVGVMRRGNLVEPHYRLDCPETEWGYAWENSMFGSILNPQDRSRHGTHLLMRKIWADANVANDNGGKEYCDVSMSWIAQWFRSETWNLIAEKGPTAIPPPMTHFRIQASQTLGAWIVYCDKPEVRKDIAALYSRWQGCEKLTSTIYYQRCTAAELQESKLPVPLRVREAPKHSAIHRLLSSSKPDPSMKLLHSITQKPLLPASATPVPAYRRSSPCNAKRKAQTDAVDDIEHSQMPTKRTRV